MGVFTFLARRYVAGKTIAEAIAVARKLNATGIFATLDILGEAVTSSEETEGAVQQYLLLLEEIKNSGAKADISMKLSMLGLDIDEQLCRRHVREILERARILDSFVWFDMESSKYTEKTVQIYIQSLHEFKHLGIAIQAYLFRSTGDVETLSKLPSHVRLVKGAYKEAKDIAFERKEDVDLNYRTLMKMLLRGSGFTAIATHDLSIIEDAKQIIKEESIPKDAFEFQMLYGIRREYWKKLVDEGYALRIYVPFGPKWLPYMLRRLRERKENTYFVLKHLFSR